MNTQKLRYFFYIDTNNQMYHPMIRYFILLNAALLFFACNDKASIGDGSIVETPCKIGGEPNLFKSPSGELYLSWIEYENDTLSVLKYAKWASDKWSSGREIARGTDWFVNWADFPAMAVGGKEDQHMAAHWLEKSGSSTYDYNVMLSQSFDGGLTWSAGEVVHKDSVSAEHGFVSIKYLEEGSFAMCWLDGRNTKLEDHEHTDEEGHGHHGSMSLRYTKINSDGVIEPSVELDHKVCDCCQTDMAISPSGPIVVYRDRSDKEIRDIYITRSVDGIWYEPKAVYQDNWEIAGCPVNGPSIAASGDNLVVFWYTMSDASPILRYALSDDLGETFDKAINLKSENPIGRVDVKFIDQENALLVWMEQLASDKTVIKAAILNLDHGLVKDDVLVETESNRNSGFPKIVVQENRLYLAWTNVATAESEYVETAVFELYL